jgi:signal transduction histidine kinase
LFPVSTLDTNLNRSKMMSTSEKSKNGALRKKAEESLKNNLVDINRNYSEADLLKLIHELQVHQVELELQNEELTIAQEKAERASKKYTDLFDFAPIGYFTVTKSAKIEELNFMGAKMLGKERAVLVGKNLTVFMSNGSKPVFNKFIERLFESFTCEKCEVVLSVEDSSTLYLYLSGIAKENEEDCLITAVDITRLKQIEFDLKQLKEHAEESDMLKTAFLQNMSHEIRTPLNAIKGFSQLLVHNHSNENKLKKFTKIIDQRCNDLLAIINDILDIAKIEAGQLPVYKEECNITDLFVELTAQFMEYRQTYDKENIEFYLHNSCLPADAVMITDKGKLKQIFVNLLTNAFKFTAMGSITGGCKSVHNKMMFFVSDTGMGIPKDKYNEVFERFTQLKQSQVQAIGGTGLGLSITKGLVNLLGGEIFLDSEPGKGTTFTFSLPAEIIYSVHHDYLENSENTVNSYSDKTILIVEDKDYNSLYLKEILSDTGITILNAELGSDAIQMARTHSVDLVLMDIRLPDMDGNEVTQIIKLHKPGQKIIALSAYAAETDKQKALDAGCSEFLSKPIDSRKLFALLKKYLS